MARTQYVKSQGVSLAYRVSGEGEVTLLQGPVRSRTSPSSTPSRPTPATLSACRAFAELSVDKRGCGLPDRSATPLTVPRQVPDVEAVRAATESERVALYGLSQGAAVAELYALAFPSRMTRLILVSGISCDAGSIRARSRRQQAQGLE